VEQSNQAGYEYLISQLTSTLDKRLRLAKYLGNEQLARGRYASLSFFISTADGKLVEYQQDIQPGIAMVHCAPRAARDRETWLIYPAPATPYWLPFYVCKLETTVKVRGQETVLSLLMGLGDKYIIMALKDATGSRPLTCEIKK
jgi:hypothetical protein